MPGKKFSLPFPVILASVFVFLFCNLFSFFVFDHIPHIHDEIDYLFQAKLFKSGRLYALSPCAKEFFDFPHMINNGRWYSQYTPGYPFLLMLGLFIASPWIINPLLGSLAIILFFLLGREIYNSQVGLLASLLGAVSIWFLLMSSTMMSHTASLFFVTLFLLFLFRSLRNPSWWNGAGAGAALGMALLIRPYNTVFISLPFCAYFSFRFLKNMKGRLKNGAAFVSAFLLFLLILLIYNQLTNGHPLRMGYVVSYGDEVLPGFGRSIIPELSLTPLLAGGNVVNYLKALHTDLFGWPLSSFLPLLPLLFAWRKNSEFRRKDLLLAAAFFSLLIGLFFYWGTFLLLGARLIFESVGLLVLLSARGIVELSMFIDKTVKLRRPGFGKKIISPILIIFVTYAFIIYLPRRVWPKDTEDIIETIAHNFSGTTPDIHRSLKLVGLTQALVLMRFINPPSLFPTGWWGSGFLHNDPDLRGDIIYAKDQGKERGELFSCFPERKLYLYLGTLDKGMLIPMTRRGEEIIYGKPLPAVRKGKKMVELIGHAKFFFNLYSKEFERFLEKLYQENDYIDVDVRRLTELGESYRKRDSFQEAAFCFEAALQVEKDPASRFFLLNCLLPCYFKTGKIEEAKKIEGILKKDFFEAKNLYFVSPEKGF